MIEVRRSISVFITEDNREFFSEEEARTYETTQKLSRLLAESGIYFRGTNEDEIAEWIVSNKEKILEILK